VLARNIANYEGNFTRFVMVARSPRTAPAHVPCRTTIAFATRHEHGALAQCLQVLAAHGLNLSRIESRPWPGRPWEYRFLVDFEGNASDDQARLALEQLATLCDGLRVLGSYAAAPRPAC
jgi:chorismate mutase/prephenate dehydratase